MIAPAPKMEPSEEMARPRAAIMASMAEGWRRAAGAPWVTAGVLVSTLLFVVPLATVASPQTLSHGFARALEQGASNATALDGAVGVASRLVESSPLTLPVAGAMAGTLVISLFLAGGVLDRLARGRRVGTGAFFSACGVYGVRFLRLAPVAVAAHWALFAALDPILKITLADRFDAVGAARESIALAIGFSLLVAAVGGLIGVIVDFAMVRLVVEDRHSAIQAIGASVRFLRRRVARALTLYVLNRWLVAGIQIAWLWCTLPGTSPAWARVLVSGGFLMLYTFARVAFLASETIFFQGELAHAHYTAAPLPTWPDSAGVEAIRNMTRSGQKAD